QTKQGFLRKIFHEKKGSLELGKRAFCQVIVLEQEIPYTLKIFRVSFAFKFNFKFIIVFFSASTSQVYPVQVSFCYKPIPYFYLAYHPFLFEGQKWKKFKSCRKFQNHISDTEIRTFDHGFPLR